MCCPRVNPCIIFFLASAGSQFLSPANSNGEVNFFLHRHGSSQDTGFDDFRANIGPYSEETFESPEFVSDETLVPHLTVGNFDLSFNAEWFGEFTPLIGWSPEFNIQGRIDGNTLLAGRLLTISVQNEEGAAAMGAWIFDDRRLYDSAYLIEVVEVDGSVSSTVLENEIPLNAEGHEVEGFAGAISDIGISEFRITAVDPVTHAPQEDFFEIDNLTVAEPPPLPPEEGSGWSDTPPTEMPDISPPASRPTRIERHRARRDQSRGNWQKRQHDREECRKQKQPVKKSCS